MDKYIRNPLNEKELLSLEGAYEVIVNLKRTLSEIRKIINDCKKLMPHEFDWDEQTDYILQIIDKALRDEENDD